MISLWSCCFQPSADAYEELNKVLQRKHQPLFNHRPCPPTWIQDQDATKCANCEVEFDLFLRKHHCRHCGKVFCANCASLFERMMKYGCLEPVRTCGSCLQQLRRENKFYECYLPLLEKGDQFYKHGFMSKHRIQMYFDKQYDQLRYRRAEASSDFCKSIELSDIEDVRDLPTVSPSAFGLVVRQKMIKFEATSTLAKALWIEAIRNTKDMQNLLSMQKQLQDAHEISKQNQQIQHIAADIADFEYRKNVMKDRRLERNRIRREELRQKYKLNIAA